MQSTPSEDSVLKSLVFTLLVVSSAEWYGFERATVWQRSSLTDEKKSATRKRTASRHRKRETDQCNYDIESHRLRSGKDIGGFEEFFGKLSSRRGRQGP
ncbi:hypothetical protein B0H14DRAFT_3014680 [Mycena olivaceomarginata]|nr:hypothetical protein B0H14DRAFT_3014680 [Mycena olivaceomarginata]